VVEVVEVVVEHNTLEHKLEHIEVRMVVHMRLRHASTFL